MNVRTPTKRQVKPVEALEPLITSSGDECGKVQMIEYPSQNFTKCALCIPGSAVSKTHPVLRANYTRKVFCCSPNLTIHAGPDVAAHWSRSRGVCQLDRSKPKSENAQTTELQCDRLRECPTRIDTRSCGGVETSIPTAVGGYGPCTHEVQIRVGQERQPRTASACALMAISPVFQVMLSDRWHNTTVDLPDIEMETLEIMMSSEGTVPCLSECTVWEVLAVADRYQVVATVQNCFHFLLHHHRQRNRSQHLCVVLETAHRLNYLFQHEECLQLAKKNARRIFRNPRALREVCRQCMRALVSADDLDLRCPNWETERRVQEAVVSWARLSWARRRGAAGPSMQQLRDEAGEMVHEVRYSALPRHLRSRLLLDGKGQTNRAASLLTPDEVAHLLDPYADERMPTCAQQARRCRGGRQREASLSSSDDEIKPCLCDKVIMASCPRRKVCVKSIVQCVGLFVFMFAIIYVPVAVLKNLTQQQSAQDGTVSAGQINTTANSTGLLSLVLENTEPDNFWLGLNRTSVTESDSDSSPSSHIRDDSSLKDQQSIMTPSTPFDEINSVKNISNSEHY